MQEPAHESHRPPGVAASLLLGVGLGGFVDGIVLHQVLQWHHMVSHIEAFPTTTTPGLEMNTLADGLFHLGAWVCVAVGSTLIVAAWRSGRLAPSWRFHFGLIITGWGTFNLAEGIINHQILGIHHVRDDLGAPLSWDIGFLIFGLLLILTGSALHRAGKKAVLVWVEHADSTTGEPT